jgi:hypothetical protein
MTGNDPDNYAIELHLKMKTISAVIDLCQAEVTNDVLREKELGRVM